MVKNENVSARPFRNLLALHTEYNVSSICLREKSHARHLGQLRHQARKSTDQVCLEVVCDMVHHRQ